MNLRVQKYAEITLHFESSFLMLTPAQWMVWQPPPQCTVLKYRGVLANSGGRDQNMATDFMFLGLPPYPISGSATRKCVHTADRRLTDHWDAHGTFFIQLHGFLGELWKQYIVGTHSGQFWIRHCVPPQLRYLPGLLQRLTLRLFILAFLKGGIHL